MEQKQIESQVVAKHFVGVKDGNPYDFWGLFVRVLGTDFPLKFDKNQAGYRSILTNYVLNEGVEVK